MNHHLRSNLSVVLMRLRPSALYANRIENNSRMLIYEGYDAPRNQSNLYLKQIDQPIRNHRGSLSRNCLFLKLLGGTRRGEKSLSLLKFMKNILESVSKSEFARFYGQPIR